jgi:hypothetical protein
MEYFVYLLDVKMLMSYVKDRNSEPERGGVNGSR